MKKAFIVLSTFTLTSFALSYVFATAAGDLPYPSSTFKSIESKLNEDLVEIDEKQTFSAENLHTLDLKVGLADLTITQSPDDQVHFHLTGSVNERKPVKVKRQDGALELKIDSESRFRWLFSDDAVSVGKSTLKAELMIPSAFVGNLEVKMGAGDIELSNLALKSLGLKVGNGDIVLSSVTADQVEIKTGKGDVKMNLGDQSRWRIEVKLGYGQVVTELGGEKTSSYSNVFEAGSGPQRLDIRTGKGDVHLSL